MSRRTGSSHKRSIIPDPVYNDEDIARFINYMMKDGKKSTAEKVFYAALDILKEKTGREAVDVFREAVQNVKPELEVRSRRVGGVTYQVPVEVRPERMRTLAVRWIVQNARDRKDHSMAEKLAYELLDAQKGSGGAVKKRDETRRMAEANKAFSHYRW
ncbi:MAG TPA: 30S ribosomal protein S7 [Leptospiraceae bacterium]|jgi:small subunit ribosomal protein S7|nr:30S ribosomal protein S7 [Leptospirales bacterium]HMU82928.1 30S ribosomal protein S7 [Leptospiraceae bacterium]HMY44294.1 30S ribosomal protein S7 [Leptospiraceae bacterium]HMZ37163.1 30S ribosomal protein S7 [Leptospiraceae bacterium]HNE24138.1 30S ribosomal protein S7 [Leptospiraceae bacterium]